MSASSKIEWTDASWTPIRARNLKTGKIGWHCEHATTGCEHCYSDGMNKRLGTGLPFKPGHRKDIDIFLDEQMLLAPQRWKKPRMIFVCSMTDAFADFVKDEWLDKMFAVMALTPHHTYQVLTKRAERMREYLSIPHRANWASVITKFIAEGSIKSDWEVAKGVAVIFDTICLPNVMLGVSTERQQEYDERKEHLRNTPAAVRFFSMEPLLGPIVADYLADWVIVGGESGSHARPMHPAWARSLRDQCGAAGVPFFFKQWGEHAFEGQHKPGGGRWVWPHDCEGYQRVGKKAASRLLDGVEHNAMPGQA